MSLSFAATPSQLVRPQRPRARTHVCVRPIRMAATGTTKGHVTLVGVGPGDMMHLTTAGRHAVQAADVILYDRLISPDILGLAARHASVQAVGKGRARADAIAQNDINTRMLALAHAGHHVVRLKGGDASIFARLASELHATRQDTISVSVVPGVTTASAVAAALHFPLTAHGVAQAVCLVSAHDGAHWVSPALLRHATLVLYMGLHQLHALSQRLVADEAACADIAAVAVQAVGTPAQNVVWGTVGDLHSKVQEEGLKSPTIIVFGDVVRLAKDWPTNKIETRL